MKKLLILLLLLSVTACGTDTTDEPLQCVPSSCCHASSCVPIDQAPDCSDTFCSLECAEDSLDCGQGSCQVIDNECQAVFN